MKKLSKKETGRTLGDSGHPIWKQEEQSVTHEQCYNLGNVLNP